MSQEKTWLLPGEPRPFGGIGRTISKPQHFNESRRMGGRPPTTARKTCRIYLGFTRNGAAAGALRSDHLGHQGVTAALKVVNGARDRHLPGMKHLDLTDTEAEALAQKLVGIVDGARYPLSRRIRTLTAVLDKLRPPPARPAAALEPRVYEPPSKGRYGRRG